MKFDFEDETVRVTCATAIVICVILAFVFGVSSVRTVSVGHVGVVTSFGHPTGRTLDSGLNLVLPWHSVHRLDTRVLNVPAETECFSKDLQLLQIRMNILTSLPKDQAQKVLTTLGPKYLNQVVPRVYEILKQEVAKYSAEMIVENREKIRSDLLTGCRLRLENLVEFQDVVLTNIDFSDVYEKAIEQKQVASQRSLQAKYELEKAKIEAEQAIATAKGEAEAIRIKGEALREAPGMAQLETIKRWDGKAPETLVLSGEQGIPFVFSIY